MRGFMVYDTKTSQDFVFSDGYSGDRRHAFQDRRVKEGISPFVPNPDW